MKTDLSATASGWGDVKNLWGHTNYDLTDFNLVTWEAFEYARQANDAIAGVGDIQAITIGVTADNFDELDELAGKLRSYCDGIFSELSAKIDEPFSRQVQGLLGLAFKLNPNEYVLSSDASVRNIEASLEDLLSLSPIDSGLQASYLEWVQQLSEDEISSEKKKLMDGSLWQWHDKMEFYDIKEIDRTIYASGHAMADIFYELSPYLVLKTNDREGGWIFSSNYYNAFTNGVYYNLENDRENMRNPYTTFFHEMGHMIDYIFYSYDGSVHSWGSGVSFNNNDFADVFFDALENDVNTYINDYVANYNTIHGTTLANADILQELKFELGNNKNNPHANDIYSGERSEISDIYGAFTNNEIRGGYYHDKGNYWGYNSKGEGPSKTAQVNREAFAHFVAISVMDDPTKVALANQYLPTAYDEFTQWADEMKERLNENRN